MYLKTLLKLDWFVVWKWRRYRDSLRLLSPFLPRPLSDSHLEAGMRSCCCTSECKMASMSSSNTEIILWRADSNKLIIQIICQVLLPWQYEQAQMVYYRVAKFDDGDVLPIHTLRYGKLLIFQGVKGHAIILFWAVQIIWSHTILGYLRRNFLALLLYFPIPLCRVLSIVQALYNLVNG